jgi:hypothetical protein
VLSDRDLEIRIGMARRLKAERPDRIITLWALERACRDASRDSIARVRGGETISARYRRARYHILDELRRIGRPLDRCELHGMTISYLAEIPASELAVVLEGMVSEGLLVRTTRTRRLWSIRLNNYQWIEEPAFALPAEGGASCQD